MLSWIDLVLSGVPRKEVSNCVLAIQGSPLQEMLQDYVCHQLEPINAHTNANSFEPPRSITTILGEQAWNIMNRFRISSQDLLPTMRDAKCTPDKTHGIFLSDATAPPVRCLTYPPAATKLLQGMQNRRAGQTLEAYLKEVQREAIAIKQVDIIL